jgi:WD40 repeat protein
MSTGDSPNIPGRPTTEGRPPHAESGPGENGTSRIPHSPFRIRAGSARTLLISVVLIIGAALIWDYYSYSAQTNAHSALQQAIATQTAQSLLSGQAQATGTVATGKLLNLNAQATQVSGDRTLARARMILARAEAQAVTDPSLGTLLAMESISTTVQAGEPPLPEAESFLRAIITRPWPGLTFQANQGDQARVLFSPDGRNNLLTTGTADQVEIRNADSGVVWRTLRSPGAGIIAAAWSPDGRSVAGFGESGRVVLWDVAAGQPITTTQGIPTLSPGIAYSPDGTRLAISAGDSDSIPVILAMGNLSGGRVALHGHTGRVNSIGWSPNGKEVLTAGDDGTVRIWDSGAGALRLTVPVTGVASGQGSIKVVQAEFSPDGSAIMTRQSDGSVRVWSAATGAADIVLPARGGSSSSNSGFTYAKWGTDSNTLLTVGEDGRGRVWSLSPLGERTILIGTGTQLVCISLSPDGMEAVTTARDGVAQLWNLDLAGYTELPAIRPFGLDVQPWESAKRFDGVKYSPDGLLLAATGGDGLLRVWDANTGEQRLALKSSTDQFSGNPAWSPDGKSLAVGGTDGVVGSAQQRGAVRVWDVASGAERLNLDGLPNEVVSVAWSPDGRVVVGGSADGPVKMWDASTGADIALLAGHTKSVSKIAYSPKGDRLATSSWDDSVRVWDTSGKQLFSMVGHTNLVRDVVWSPDGKRLATVADDNSARIWDAGTGAQLAVITGHGNLMPGVAWSPDGTRVALAEDDGSVRVWELAAGPSGSVTPREVLTIQQNSGQGQSKLSRTWHVQYSPDGQLIISSYESGGVGIWSAGTGASAGSYQHHDQVTGIDYSPDGCRLASAGWDGQVLQVPTCMKDLIGLAQQYAGRSLTQQERSLFLDNLP